MQALRLKGAAFAYGDASPLFDSVDLHLTPGWYGLVGPNGSGKSTLLRVLSGVLRPDAGLVRSDPPDASIVTCAQDVHDASDDLAALAERQDAGAYRLRATLGLDPATLSRWSSLSPGERKRWQIGAALAREPDVLLLDEPSNHLDAPARAWLLTALARFRGIGVVVSHDRALLGALTRATIRVHRGRVETTPGAYDDAKREWERGEREAQGNRDLLSSERDSAERQLGDARRARASAERSLSSKRTDPRDHDARSMARKGLVQRAEKSLARLVSSRHSALERASDRLASTEPAPRELGGPLFVDWEPAPRGRVLSAYARPSSAQATPSSHARSPSTSRATPASTSPVRTGPGRAPSSAPSSMAARSIPIASSSSRRTPRPRRTRHALDALRALDPGARGRVLSFVAALGVDPDRLLASRQPSPGEARKLRIATGLGRRVWALVLDEPTNHLDLPSVERLERALDRYPGALVVASHDESFARACRCETWRIEGGLVVRA